MKITILNGGVGGSKLALGLYHEFREADLTFIVNTADDVDILGLHISPDVDTLMYTLAGIVDPVRGWGLDGDTYAALSMLRNLGHDGWFQLGDRDLATHLTRSFMLGRGATLTQVTDELRTRLGVRARILPMTNHKVRTLIKLDDGWVEFQDYFVKRGHAETPRAIDYAGADSADATTEVANAISTADIIVVAPSNPVVSIGPILALRGVSSLLSTVRATKIAVSPFLGEKSITGPADALMTAIGFPPTSLGLAEMYSDWLDVLVLHSGDSAQSMAIESMGVGAVVTDTLMPDLAAKRRVAKGVVLAVSGSA